MFFKSDRVLEACRCELDDTKVFGDIYKRLIDGRLAPPDYPKHLMAFLKELPGVEEQAKILRRFSKIAESHACTIEDFRWWEIVPHDRILFASIQRERRKITVVFWWKDTAKGEQRISMNNPNPAWVPDVDAPGCWRVQFEAATYQEVKAHFERWLMQPLELPVQWVA
ncbi:MAG: hypothetical protein RDU25_01210 [Patescibacteria group bacterium]|nr:hypothetical protein [Patescibacteria group bacterium]